MNRHLSEALETLLRTVSKSDLISRDRDDLPRWMVERFEEQQRANANERIPSIAKTRKTPAS
jgi:hypothetical protein